MAGVGDAKVEKFTGMDESKYPQRKIWAENYLFKLEKRGFPADALGAELVGLLPPDTPAFEVIMELKQEDIRSDGGDKLIWTLWTSGSP